MNPDELSKKIDITGNYTLYYNGHVSSSRQGHAAVPLIDLLRQYHQGQEKLAELEKGLAGLRELIMNNTDSCPFCRERWGATRTSPTDEQLEPGLGTSNS